MNTRNKKKNFPFQSSSNAANTWRDTAQTSPKHLPFWLALSSPLCFLLLADIHWPCQETLRPPLMLSSIHLTLSKHWELWALLSMEAGPATNPLQVWPHKTSIRTPTNKLQLNRLPPAPPLPCQSLAATVSPHRTHTAWPGTSRAVLVLQHHGPHAQRREKQHICSYSQF